MSACRIVGKLQSKTGEYIHDDEINLKVCKKIVNCLSLYRRK